MMKQTAPQSMPRIHLDELVCHVVSSGNEEDLAWVGRGTHHLPLDMFVASSRLKSRLASNVQLQAAGRDTKKWSKIDMTASKFTKTGRGRKIIIVKKGHQSPIYIQLLPSK